MDKLVSVIVPVYNVERYLEDCVHSIVNQTYQSLEIILVDDGSTDRSGVLCDQLSETDERISVIHQDNAGLSGARNTGIDCCNGDFILFVDSDDLLVTDIVERLASLCEEYSADIVSCNSIRCNEDDRYENISIPEITEDISILKGNEKMLSFLTEDKIKVVAWGKLYRRYIFDELRYPLGKYNEDNYTTYLAVHYAKIIVCTNKVGCIYRINKKSITNEKFSLKRMNELEGKLQQLDFINTYYPQYSKNAEAAIVYACNQILLLQGRAKFRDKSIFNEFSSYYKKYLIAYLRSSANLVGKLFAITARFNINLAHYIARFI